jgi:hypothetical protein
MKENRYPSHGELYSIKPFYTDLTNEVLFLDEYTDLFGENYKKIFIENNGKIFLLAEVESWTALNMKRHV